MTRIIVVVGGAGGLELATKLGRAMGRKGSALCSTRSYVPR